MKRTDEAKVNDNHIEVNSDYIDGVVNRLLKATNTSHQPSSFIITRLKNIIIFDTYPNDIKSCKFSVKFHATEDPNVYTVAVNYTRGKELFDYLFPGLFKHPHDDSQEQIQQLITLVIDKLQCSYEEAVDIICKSVVLNRL